MRSRAVLLLLVLIAATAASTAVQFAFREIPRSQRELAGVFVAVAVVELAAHVVVLAALFVGRRWGSIAALVLAGVNVILVGPAAVGALLLGVHQSAATGRYTHELALPVVIGAQSVTVVASVILILVIAHRMRSGEP